MACVQEIKGRTLFNLYILKQRTANPLFEVDSWFTFFHITSHTLLYRAFVSAIAGMVASKKTMKIFGD